MLNFFPGFQFWFVIYSINGDKSPMWSLTVTVPMARDFSYLKAMPVSHSFLHEKAFPSWESYEVWSRFASTDPSLLTVCQIGWVPCIPLVMTVCFQIHFYMKVAVRFKDPWRFSFQLQKSVSILFFRAKEIKGKVAWHRFSCYFWKAACSVSTEPNIPGQ